MQGAVAGWEPGCRNYVASCRLNWLRAMEICVHVPKLAYQCEGQH